MIAFNRADIETHFGSVEALNEQIAAYTEALAKHATTVDVPAPTAHPLVERLVRQFGGKYEVADDPEVVAKGLTFEQMRDAKLAEIAAFRWQAQNIGVPFNGNRVGSDSATLTTLVAYMLTGKTEPLNFKIGPTTFVELTRGNVQGLIIDIQGHVQSCFDRERELIGAVMKARSKKAIAEIEVS